MQRAGGTFPQSGIKEKKTKKNLAYCTMRGVTEERISDKAPDVKILIKLRWKAFRSGFCSFVDFMEVAVLQCAIYMLPVWFQRLVYKKMLRQEI